MKPIPASLLAKIKKANQSIYNNADPKMDVIIRRARSGLTVQDLFYVQTIREEPELQDLEMVGIALERADAEKGPHKAWNIYIQNGICRVATKNLPSRAREEWVDVLTIGPAVECDLTFDGRWVRDKVGRWNLITEGNPWLFWTTANGDLYGQHWNYGSPVLLAEGVGKIAALRAWRSPTTHHFDQGVVLAYCKDGTLLYRAYCFQEDGSRIWETERIVSGAPEPANDIGLFRSNDYRLGFVVESAAGIYLGMVERILAGMAIPNEYMYGSFSFSEIELIPIENLDVFSLEHIWGNYSSVVGFCSLDASPSIVVNSEVIDPYTLSIIFSNPLVGEVAAGIRFITVTNVSETVDFMISGLQIGESANELIIELEDPLDMENDVRIELLDNGWLFTRVEPSCIIRVGPFVEVIPIAIDPDFSESIFGAFQFSNIDFVPIVYSDTDFSESLGGRFAFTAITFTKIGQGDV